MWRDFPHPWPLQLLSPVLCKWSKVKCRNSNRFTKYTDSSFQILSFKDVIKPNSPNIGEDLNGSRCSEFYRWQIKGVGTSVLALEPCSAAPDPSQRDLPLSMASVAVP